MPAGIVVHADKGYDTDRVRRLIEGRDSAPNIPPRSHRRWKNCFSPYLYRSRNAIERMFSRLKDSRRIATRYDKLAVNFLAAVCLAATVSYWLECVWKIGDGALRWWEWRDSSFGCGRSRAGVGWPRSPGRRNAIRLT